jgi:hypothetical protein
VSCVGAPVRRVARQNSGGTPKPTNDCSGSLVFDMNVRIQAAVDPNLVPGARVFAQYLYRDPLDFGRPVGSTDAVDFTIHP